MKSDRALSRRKINQSVVIDAYSNKFESLVENDSSSVVKTQKRVTNLNVENHVLTTKVKSLERLMRNNSLKFMDLNYIQRLNDGLNEGRATTDRGQIYGSIGSMSTIGEENYNWNTLTAMEKSKSMLDTNRSRQTTSLMQRSGVYIPHETQIAQERILRNESIRLSNKRQERIIATMNGQIEHLHQNLEEFEREAEVGFAGGGAQRAMALSVLQKYQAKIPHPRRFVRESGS